MNGAESLVKTLLNAGVEVCFANPGTSEMHFVAALDKIEGMRAILGLFEGIVTGAADGYGRMAEKPAATLLHLGPGLANGAANLHNAKKANTPIVNIIGEHATYHRQYDAPLQSDINSLASPVSHHVETCLNSDQIANYGANAVKAAMTAPGKISSLILPADVSWNENQNGPVEGHTDFSQFKKGKTVAPEHIAEVEDILKSGEPCLILMNGQALSEEGLALANQIANCCSARLCCDTFTPKLARGAGRAKIDRLPYFGEMVVEELKAFKNIIFVGTKAPVSFFAYPGQKSSLVPEGCHLFSLAEPEDNAIQALRELAEAVDANDSHLEVYAENKPELPTEGALDITSVAAVFAALLPENAIVSDESNTSGIMLMPLSEGSAKHDWLSLTGGAIGQGLPVAVGAAIACPDRKVICMQADGSAMYTIQSLWTMARENLDVTTVIFSNRAYAILQIELARVGVLAPGEQAKKIMDLSSPNLDFVSLAEGMGVSATVSNTITEFIDQFSKAMQSKGPKLIEVIL